MIAIFTILLAFAIMFATMAWLRGRPRKWLFPSDVFFILCLLTSGFVPFVNLRAESQFSVQTHFSDQDIGTTLISLSIMFVTFGLIWTLRPRLNVADLIYDKQETKKRNLHIFDKRTKQFLWGSGYFIFGFSILLMIYPPYLQYKLQVIEFLLGRIDENDYQLARRVTFADDNFIIGFVGRLRYNIYPVVFVATALLALKRRGVLASATVAVLAFVVGPASFAKASVVIFLIYFVIAVLLARGFRVLFVARNAIFGIGAALGLLLVLLTAIYLLQYRDQFSGSDAVPRAFSLAYFRIFVATYGGLLQYISAFPNGDVGISASVVAPIFGLQTRALDQEVAIAYLGHEIGMLTTFPTIFIGNAYAAFGYIGVFIFSIIVGLTVVIVDQILVKLHIPTIRVIYYSIMIMQVNFFAILSAQTVIVTYGLLVIPIGLLLMDRIIYLHINSVRRYISGRLVRPHKLRRPF